MTTSLRPTAPPPSATSDPAPGHVPDPHPSDNAAPAASPAGTSARTTAATEGWITVGILIVGITSGIMSWSAWVHLADLVSLTATITLAGVTIRLAWLLPISVDVFLVTTTRVWQLPKHRISQRTRNFARRCSLGALAVSILASGTYFALVLPGGIQDPLWWIAMTTSALPTVALALTAHLRALLTADRHAQPNNAEATMATSTADTTMTRADHGTLEWRDETTPVQEQSRHPRAVKSKADTMRAYFRDKVAAGHIPTGQDMANAAGASGSHARTERRKLLARLPTGGPHPADANQAETPSTIPSPPEPRQPTPTPGRTREQINAPAAGGHLAVASQG